MSLQASAIASTMVLGKPVCTAEHHPVKVNALQ